MRPAEISALSYNTSYTVIYSCSTAPFISIDRMHTFSVISQRSGRLRSCTGAILSRGVRHSGRIVQTA